jgi:hypothetical protein
MVRQILSRKCINFHRFRPNGNGGFGLFPAPLAGLPPGRQGQDDPTVSWLHHMMPGLSDTTSVSIVASWGAYNGNIVITSPGSGVDSIQIPTHVDTTGLGPLLLVYHDSLYFTWSINPEIKDYNQHVDIMNAGAAPIISWMTLNTIPWLSLTPPSSNIPLNTFEAADVVCNLVGAPPAAGTYEQDFVVVAIPAAKELFTCF